MSPIGRALIASGLHAEHPHLALQHIELALQLYETSRQMFDAGKGTCRRTLATLPSALSHLFAKRRRFSLILTLSCCFSFGFG